MLSARISEAPVVWNYLNGLVNVFKPADVSIRNLRPAILGNICKDLNQLEVREPRKRLLVENSAEGNNYDLKVIPDLADHILSVGPRYQIEDIRFNIASHLGPKTSGVLLIGLNRGTKDVFRIRNNQLLRAYHITGRLGTATETNFKDSRIVARSTFTHIVPEKMSSLLSSMQASHQKKMFEMSGIDIQSQTAYDIAVRGLIRPSDSRIPVIYGLRCIKFNRPDFVIELHAINETEQYMCELIHEIGLQLHTVAHCTSLRCIRYGQFNVNDSLLRRDWTLQNVLTNMQLCRNLLAKYPNMFTQTNVQLSSE